jgi:peptidoglycan endopeptidase LytF
MSRKDTVIIAALVNTGLLALLFMMATTADIEGVSNLHNVDHTLVGSERTTQIQEKPASPLTQIASKDELDQVLKSYALSTQQNEPTEILIVENEPTLVPPTTPNPPNSPQEPKQSEERLTEVTVKRGDSLDKIARANGTSVKEIMRINQLKNERLDIGQILRVPYGKKKEVVKTTTTKPISQETPAVKSAEVGTEYYTLKTGDNPWKVAKQFHVRFDQLLKMNNLDEAKARNLKPGDVLRVK